MPPQRTFLVRNARILTLDPRLPRADAMVADRGRIAFVGSEAQAAAFVGRRAQVVDCQGATVLPGFIDAHCHPLALGARLAEIDCSPDAVRSIREIKTRLRAASRLPGPPWLKAWGYDEILLAEHRHPDRRDLDDAVPDRPVRLAHGSGHALVLNTIGLREVGIDAATPEPPGGTIDRGPSTGEPTGLLLEMNDFVARRMPAPSERERRAAARRASEALVSAGVTSVTDAGSRNDGARVELYRNLHAAGAFAPRTTVMVAGDAEIPRIPDGGLVRAGAVKLMLSLSRGRLSPSQDELRRLIAAAVGRGARAVAVHAVEEAAVIAACAALSGLDTRPARMRIEHASECPPHAVAALARCAAAVVTQPGFIWQRGARYVAAAREGGPDADVLYPLRSLVDAGVTVAGGTDAPFGTWRPAEAIAAAASRETRGGQVVGGKQGISIAEGLRLFGPRAAEVEDVANTRGALAPGKVADFVVLDVDLPGAGHRALARASVLRTVIGGVTVWPPG